MTPSRFESIFMLLCPRSGQGAFAVHLLLLLFCVSQIFACSPSGRDVLRAGSEVNSLGGGKEAEGQTVRLQGIVTYVDSVTDALVVQDETAGVYVHASGPPFNIVQGQRVEIRGSTARGGVYPVVLAEEINSMGSGELPAARRIDIGEAVSTEYENQWVQIRGVVRAASVEHDGQSALMLASGKGRVRVRVNDLAGVDLHRLVDTRVRLHGVAKVRVDTDGKPFQYEILSQRLDVSEVGIGEKDDAFRRPVTSVASVLRMQPEEADGHRVHIRATVLDRLSAEMLRLKDQTGEILAQMDPAYLAGVGDLVDVVGFPAFGHTEVILENALAREVGERSRSLQEPSGEDLTHSDKLPLLTRIEDALTLSPEEASRGYLVQFRAVVTYYDPDWNLLVIQDETSGISVNLHEESRYDLEVGDLVELRGRTDPGEYAPVIVDPRVRYLGKGTLPPISESVHDHVFSGQADSRWIELEGVVRCVHYLEFGHLMFDIVKNGYRISVFIPANTSPVEPRRLIDSHVRVRGVAAAMFNNKRQLIEMRLYSPGGEFVQIEVPSEEDPFSLPVRSISHILRFTPGEPVDHRIRIQGEVLFYTPGRELWLRDETGGIQVRTPDDLSLQTGDRVDVVGFAETGHFAPFLQDGSVRRLGAGTPPAAIPMSVDQVLEGDSDGQLVEMEAELVERTYAGSRVELTLRADEHVYHAVLAGPSAASLAQSLQVGSVLRVRGVCTIDRFNSTEANATPVSFKLLLRTSDDVAVVKPAPWWTFENLVKLMAVLAGLMLLMIGWVVALKRRVRHQTRIIASKLEEEAKLKEEAQSASEAKSRFLSAVSHELRTPLTSILGYADILEDEAQDRLQPEEQEYLRTVRFSGERLLNLVNDLLDVSAAEAGHLHVETNFFEAMPLVFEVVKQLYPLAETKGIHLAARGNANLWVHADETRLRQVLINLISNAVKFTDEGEVMVEVIEGKLTGGDGALLPAVSFSVIDSGEGIAPEFMPHLFEYFSQDKSARGNTRPGTGLGLAISRELVHRMGGVITVESQPGVGAQFTFVLPAGVPPQTVRRVDVPISEVLQ